MTSQKTPKLNTIAIITGNGTATCLAHGWRRINTQQRNSTWQPERPRATPKVRGKVVVGRVPHVWGQLRASNDGFVLLGMENCTLYWPQQVWPGYREARTFVNRRFKRQLCAGIDTCGAQWLINEGNAKWSLLLLIRRLLCRYCFSTSLSGTYWRRVCLGKWITYEP